MPCYRAYPFPGSKLFLAMGVPHSTSYPFNDFKAMFNISIKYFFFQIMLLSNLTAIYPKI